MSQAKGVFKIQTENGTYPCKLNTAAMCLFEERAGLTFAEMGEKFQKGKVGMQNIRDLLWAVLNWKHVDDYGQLENDHISIGLASEIMDELIERDGPQAAVEKISEGLEMWMPDDDDIEGEIDEKKTGE